MQAKKTSAYIGVREVRGQEPGTIHGEARTKSAINNTQAVGLRKGLRRAGVSARRSNPRSRTSTGPEGRMYSTAPVTGATIA